jgi:hypothetical protein
VFTNLVTFKMDDQEAKTEKTSEFGEIKHKWYFSSPDKLYDQCIKFLVTNIDLLLVVSKKRACQLELDDGCEASEVKAIEANDCVTSKLDSNGNRHKSRSSKRGKGKTNVTLQKIAFDLEESHLCPTGVEFGGSILSILGK